MSTRATSAVAVVVALAVGGCGGASTKSGGGGADAGALSAEARSAATGDIPDNQVFLVFRNRAGGYSVKYPEGWTQHGRGGNITFQDKNNLIHVVAAGGSGLTPSQAQA